MSLTTIYFVAVGACLAGLAVRTSYETLKQDGRVDPKRRVVFGVVFAAMVTMLLSWPVMCPHDPWRIAVPGAVRWGGLGLVGTALALAFGGLTQLRGLEDVDHLVTTGLYARLRHPMYLGFTLWIAGWVACYGALFSLLVALVALASIRYWRGLEERALEARYGDAYRRYRQSTWA